jgi:nitrite reductase/ring-hydroxylating ferredoxin subunit/Fe-S cluster biogenesis protein NfuA
MVTTTPSERADLTGLLGDIERLRIVFAGWDPAQRAVADAYGRALEALYGEALARLVRALKIDPAALRALTSAASDEVVYATLRRHGILKPSLNERIEAALESVRPMLASHGGNVELVSVEPPAASVRFLGACDGCAASALTFHEGVAKAVKAACPEIDTIHQAKGSAEGASRAASLQGDPPLMSPFDLLDRGTWRRAAEVADIPDGGVRAVELGDESLLLARLGAVVTCFDNACAHLGMPLDGGGIKDGVLSCPQHGFAYDLSTGECITAPSVQLRVRRVRVVGDRVEVRVTQ